MASNQEPVDWNRLIEKLAETAITVLGNKLQGTKAPIVQEGTAISSPFGSVSNGFVAIALVGILAVGAVILIRH